MAVELLAAIWDGVGTCENQKVSKKINKNEKKNIGHIWQPVALFPHPIAVVHGC
jgi:hypothetical protein